MQTNVNLERKIIKLKKNKSHPSSVSNEKSWKSFNVEDLKSYLWNKSCNLRFFFDMFLVH